MKKQIEQLTKNPEQKQNKISEELFQNLAIPESFSDFLNRLKTYIQDLDCMNTKDCLENIVSIFENMKIPPYADIIQKIENFDKDNESIFEVIKSKEIKEFEWEVVSISFDVIWSTKLDSNKLKNLMKQIIYNINTFENLYKNEWLQMFSINGDEIHIWFFSDKLSQQKKVEIFQLLSMILHLTTWKDFHHVMLTWEKKKWEDITAVFQENMVNTIVSESYSWNYKNSKKSELPNYIDTSLLKKIKKFPYIPNWVNIIPYLKTDFDKLEENITYLEQNNVSLHRILSKLIINYISNNLQNETNLLKNKEIEITSFKKWEKIISYWEKNTDLYLILDGDIEIQIFWNPNLAKYSSWKTIVGEMSMYGRSTNANVIAKSQIKALKINKKFIEDVLTWNIIIDARLTKQLDILFKKYIKWRENYNLILNQYFQELIEFGNKPLNEVKDTWNLFLEMLIKSENSFKKVQNKQITFEWKENDKIYFLKAGTIVRKNWRELQLENDEIIWENTFLQYMTWNKSPKANANIEVVDWEMIELDFEQANKVFKENDLDIEKIQEILEKIAKVRENNNDFMWFWWKNIFYWDSPFKKTA